MQVLQRYSGIELRDEVVSEWVKTGTVAFKLPNEGLSTAWGSDAARVNAMNRMLSTKKYGTTNDPTPQLKQK